MKKQADIDDWQSFKESSAKFRNGPLTAIFTRKLSIRTTYLIRNTSITPNMVTTASFIIFLGGVPFFVIGYKNYIYMVVGVIITQFSYILDCSDGELARYKKQISALGAWLDSVFDRLKEGAVFLAMTANVFLKTNDYRYIFVGFFAFINVIIAGYITDTKINLNLQKTDSIVKIGKNYLIGLVEIIVFGVAFAALFNCFEYLLLFFCFAGPLMWIYQLIVLVRKSKKIDSSP
ncbi:MAG: CDP-alcohol phosphatidyltransferase family protein [Spirochaetota bacterium]|nr:CDP-alcohol phosphatidyltransferase family protein [Spirochaetota bacterium]